MSRRKQLLVILGWMPFWLSAIIILVSVRVAGLDGQSTTYCLGLGITMSVLMFPLAYFFRLISPFKEPSK